ncbi:hypothetical protein DPM19_10370 [Actinomadura craniellae]|uniref:Uncharacterized protein n=1 Tax=Actinomadura craniellae TaxID=2231787 RepID=A0A365H7M7_9ACTN|nr:hypothetical protein [Actinomadura craniellae]RAY15124.1 hypothetical protein DPM19_10370 [Actinomadura craniellae]
MGYPGDRDGPGGWPGEQPPYGGEPQRPDSGPTHPFSPRLGGEGTAATPSPWAQDPPTQQYGSSYDSPGYGSDPYGSDPYGDPPGRYGTGHPQGLAQEPPDELYGTTGERYFTGPGDEPEEYTRHRSTPPRRERNRMPLVIGGAALAGVVLIAGGFGLSAVLKDDPEPAPAAASAPPATPTAAPTPTTSPQVPLNTKIKTRTTDPQALTFTEIFNRSRFTVSRTRYVMTARRAERSCARAVNGTALATAITRGGCSQVLRATFARSDGALVGTVGVFNLSTENAAKLAQRAGGGKDTYLQPLPGGGVTRKIGKGAALGTISVRGHYLVMTWVQRPDGKAVPAAQHKAVSTFGQHVTWGSNLTKALHYRGIEGKPYGK